MSVVVTGARVLVRLSPFPTQGTIRQQGWTRDTDACIARQRGYTYDDLDSEATWSMVVRNEISVILTS